MIKRTRFAKSMMDKTIGKGQSPKHRNYVGTALNKCSTFIKRLPNLFMVRLTHWGERRLFNSHEILLLMAVFLL